MSVIDNIRNRISPPPAPGGGPLGSGAGLPPRPGPEARAELSRRRDELAARVAELQWDLGGLVYEMATRDHISVELLVKRAAEMQAVDSELAELERILRMDETATVGDCPTCGAPHSRGAVYCWQCGTNLLAQVPSSAIGG